MIIWGILPVCWSLLPCFSTASETEETVRQSRRRDFVGKMGWKSPCRHKK